MQTLQDLFRNPAALDRFLREMAQKVSDGIGVTASSKGPTRVEPVDILLSQLFLRQTPDNEQTRDQLIKRAAIEVQNRLEPKSTLSNEGIRFEVQYDAPAVGYHLVGQIWY